MKQRLLVTPSYKEAYFECKSKVEQKLRSYEFRDYSAEAYEDGFFDGASDATTGSTD